MSRALIVDERERAPVNAYLLWLPCLFGVAGLHRLYAGRWISGLLWLFTFGLCGFGQVIDLVFIPRMIADYNDGRPVW